MNKRGMELSVGFMVILIITIIIFAGSLYFLRQFYVTTTEFREEIDRDTEEQLLALMRDGSIVAVSMNKATLPVGKGDYFWIGIQNLLGAEKDFGLVVEFSNAFSPTETRITSADGTFINDRWIAYNPGPHAIKNNDHASIPIRIVVNREMNSGVTIEKGTFVFNVCVFDATESQVAPGPCDGTNLDLWYTKKIYKIFIEVP